MKKRQMNILAGIPANYEAIHTGIVDLLHAARSAAARSVNSLMTAAYWEIGRRIVQFEQRGEARADYGKQLIEQLATNLSKQLAADSGQRTSPGPPRQNSTIASLVFFRIFFATLPKNVSAFPMR
jgi:hypothetical protein